MMQPRQIRNPFPGLRPFETDEYRLFFGREGQSDELLARLQRARFLAVVGASGSGKSSLIRAGLLPALRGGLMAGAGSGWRIAVMRPGGDPIGNLARELAETGVLPGAGGGLPSAEAEAVIEATLRAGSLGLVDVARQGRLAANEKLLVVVDQFEELFRFRAAALETTSTGDEASAFVKLLLEASQQRDLSIFIVLTMRSDFLGDCAQFQGLPEAINDGQYLIPRQTRDERRFAITGPVGVTRGKITEPLVNRLLNDVGDNPDQLPILQHALMRTWNHWQTRSGNGEPIGVEHYEAIGTMSTALSLHADEAFHELPDKRSQLIAETLFKALSERGADNREIRRPTSLQAICEITAASIQQVTSVIDVFRGGGRSFLMPPAGVALQPETVIDISHESLIRNWVRLKDWVNEEAQSARIYRRLAEAAVLHREGSEGLLQDPALQIALEWREKSQPNAAWGRRYHPEFETAIAYLDDSRTAREAELAAKEREREEQLARERRELEMAKRYAEEQHRSAQRLRRFTFALVLISLLAMTAAGVSVYAFAQAKKEKKQADDAKQTAVGLAAELKQSLEGERAANKIAEEGRAAAVTAEGIAQKAKGEAEEEKARAEEESRRAREAERQAKEEEAKTEKLLKQSEILLRAQQANGLFRDATILAERGDFAAASRKYEETIKGLQEHGVNDLEGVADTHVQLGQVRFSSMGGTDMAFDANQLLADRGVEHYDEAAKLYATKAASPDKAAGALLSVSETLLKIAGDKPVGRRSRGEVDELAALSITPHKSEAIGITLYDDADEPKIQLKNKALERYKRAFEFYRKAGNVTGTKTAAFRIGNFYLSGQLKPEQDTTPVLDVESCVGLDRETRVNELKAFCYFKELERLSLSNGSNDADIYRLLVLMGALSFGPGDGSDSEAYFKRARQVYMSLFRRAPAREQSGLVDLKRVAPSVSSSSEPAPAVEGGDAWRDAAEISEAAGLRHAALSLYQRALNVYLAKGDYSGVARMFYKQGDLRRKSDAEYAAGYTGDVTALFKNAVEAYKTNLRKGHLYAGVEELFDIGSHAEEVNDHPLAVDAYRTALALGEARHDLAMQARAWSEIGKLETKFSPKEARQSYMRAFILYSRHRDAIAARSTDEGEKVAREMRRISALVQSLDKEIRLKAEAAREPLTKEAFCPYPVAVYPLKAVHQDGEPVVFNGNIVYEGPATLKFSWTISPSTAKVISGDNEREFIVDGTGLGGQVLTATLLVFEEGGPVPCRQTAQASTLIASPKPNKK